MTMPKTAAMMKTLPVGILPEELNASQLYRAVTALRDDLPGDPIGYIERTAPRSTLCECGAVHLRVDASDLDTDTAASLHRLLATPYGDIVREHMRRQAGFKTIRFGWDGIENKVPSFVQAVIGSDTKNVHANMIGDGELKDIIEAFRQDMPKVMDMIEQSATNISVYSVSPTSEDAGHAEWKALIDQVMFAWSTPVRKYLSEWLAREYGLYGGAVNCCIIMTGLAGDETNWRRSWIIEQTNQQLTPDC